MKLANTLLATAAIAVLGTAAMAAEGSVNTDGTHTAPNAQTDTRMNAQGDSAIAPSYEGDASAGVTAGADIAPATPAATPEHKQAAKAPAATMDIETVQSVQASLRNEGHTVSVDGVWGPKTAQALREFQRDNSLPTTGTLNAETLAALNLR